jgi:hypothetical protein
MERSMEYEVAIVENKSEKGQDKAKVSVTTHDTRTTRMEYIDAKNLLL